MGWFVKITLAVIAVALLWGAPLPFAEADPPMYPCDFVAPIYPSIARLSRTQGDVSIQAEIDSSGRPVGIEVLHDTANYPNGEILERAALNAIREWRFCSLSSSGTKKEKIMILFKFRLAEDPKPRNADEWYPTNVSFKSPGTVEVSTTTATILTD